MAMTFRRGMVLVLVGALLATLLALALSGPAQAVVADLKIKKTASASSVSVGENFVWTVRVSNKGRIAAKSVKMTDTLPYSSVRLTNVVASQGGPCQVDFPKVVCTLGTLGVGETATVKLYVRPTEAGSLKNRAKVTTSTPEAQPLDNKASSTVRAS